MSKVTFVIPIYDDADSLSKLIDLISSVEDNRIKFLVIDNGSSDPHVVNVLENGNQDKYDWLRIEKNLGFGGGILFGIEKSMTDWVGWMPGNLKIDPNDLPNFLNKCDFSDETVIKASRRGRSLSAYTKTYLAGYLQSLILRKNMLDSGGTPTVCHKGFIESLQSPPMDYLFESYILHQAQLRKKTIQRPSINYGTRKYGQSHWQRGIRSEMKLLTLIWQNSKLWRKDQLTLKLARED